MGESHIEHSAGQVIPMKPITADDLTLLSAAQPQPSVLKKIRDHHHKLAWMIAKGMRTGEIARDMGMSISRISILKSDPAFKELIEAYRGRVEQIEEDAFREVAALRAHNEYLALQEINERLEESPETFAARDLLEIASDSADRDGRPKTSRSLHLNANFDLAEALAASKRRHDLLLSASPPEQARDANAEGGQSLPAESPPSAGEVT